MTNPVLVTRLKKQIGFALGKFNLDLKGKTVLTEAAAGNYVVTPIIAALAGAKVWALARNSKYGSLKQVEKETLLLSSALGVTSQISVITDLGQIDLSSVDILTNTGFLRPITAEIIQKMPSRAVIPLMWETWEFRPQDLDIEACRVRGIKVYGTNEDDGRLKTKEYLGYLVLRLLLDNGYSPRSAGILLLGNRRFLIPVVGILKKIGYRYGIISKYSEKPVLENYSVIILLEHERDLLLLGKDGFFRNDDISAETLVIHICGNVSFSGAKFRHIPDEPKPFGYMSFTADFVDSQAVIDLHTAGLKVAEGMLKANQLKLEGKEYKEFIEKKYPGVAFKNARYW